MRPTVLLSLVTLVIGIIAAATLAGPPQREIPEFDFDVWGSPPSRRVYTLAAEPDVQKILYSIKEEALESSAIAERIGASQAQVDKKLAALAELGLARQQEKRWISMIPMYTKEEIRAEVQRCMDIGKSCPGFFMAVGNHIPANTPVENALYYNEVYEELARR